MLQIRSLDGEIGSSENLDNIFKLKHNELI